VVCTRLVRIGTEGMRPWLLICASVLAFSCGESRHASLRLRDQILVDGTGLTSIAPLDKEVTRVAAMSFSGALYEVCYSSRTVAILLQRRIQRQPGDSSTCPIVASAPERDAVVACWGRLLGWLEWPGLRSLASTVTLTESAYALSFDPREDRVLVPFGADRLGQWKKGYQSLRSIRQLPSAAIGARWWINGIRSVAVSSSGSLIALARGGHVEVWETAERGMWGKLCSVQASRDALAQCVAFSPNSEFLYAGTSQGEIIAYSLLRRWVVQRRLLSLDETKEPDCISTVVVSPSGEDVAVGGIGEPGGVYLLSRRCNILLDAQSTTTESIGLAVNGLVFSPDGTKLLTCDSKGILSVWDIQKTGGQAPK